MKAVQTKTIMPIWIHCPCVLLSSSGNVGGAGAQGMLMSLIDRHCEGGATAANNHWCEWIKRTIRIPATVNRATNTPGPTFAFPQFDSKNLDHGGLLVAPVSRNARCGASTQSISKSAPPLPFLCLKLLAVKDLSPLGDPLHKILWYRRSSPSPISSC